MLVVNIFWVLINVVIEFLASSLQWIPPKPTPSTEQITTNDTEFNHKSTNTKVDEFLIALDKSTNAFHEYESKLLEVENQEDEKEYNLILNNPLLSPLAFIWLGLKKTFRFLQRAPRKISYFLGIFVIKLFTISASLKTFLVNLIEVITYYLNPLNLFEDLYDILMTVLIRLMFPALLTPIILFFPMKNSIFLDQVWKIILYILLVGGLRLGAEFYSLYLRYLANSKLLDEQRKTL